MAWFRIDDSFDSHPKVRRIPRKRRMAAIYLWTMAGLWCAKHTDGHFPSYMLEDIDPSDGAASTADDLVTVGLWEVVDDGWIFHDWLDYNPAKAVKEHVRKARAEAGRRGGLASGRKRAARNEVPEDEEASPEQAAVGDTHQTEATMAATDEAIVQHTASNLPSNLLASNEPPARPHPTRPVPKGTNNPPPESADADPGGRDDHPDVEEDPPKRQYPVLFDEFYAAYPKHVGKDDALKAWLQAQRRASKAEILAGAQRYAADPNLPERKMIPYPATWLRRGGWDDDPCDPPSRPAANGRASPALGPSRATQILAATEGLDDELRAIQASRQPRSDHQQIGPAHGTH